MKVKSKSVAGIAKIDYNIKQISNILVDMVFILIYIIFYFKFIILNFKLPTDDLYMYIMRI